MHREFHRDLFSVQRQFWVRSYLQGDLNNFQSEIYLHVGKKIIKFKVPSSFEQHSLNIIISYIVFILNKIKTNNFFKLIKKFPIVHGRGMKHKLQIGNKKINLIDESYNASPTSMDNSINYFENLICEKNQKKFLVLGQMNELGKKDLFFHRNLVIKLSKTNIYKVIFCGNIYKDILNKITFNKEKFSNVSNENGSFNKHVLDAILYLLTFIDSRKSIASG